MSMLIKPGAKANRPGLPRWGGRALALTAPPAPAKARPAISVPNTQTRIINYCPFTCILLLRFFNTSVCM